MEGLPVLYENVSVLSVSAVDAPHRVSSADLEKRLSGAIKDAWGASGLLELLSGIKARRFFDHGVQPSVVATKAADRAIAQAGIDPQRLGILINTSVCRDFLEPSVACLVHGNLGLHSSCINFDVGNACLGFLSGMEIVAGMIERGQVDYGIVVDGENSRGVVDKTISRLASGCRPEELRENFATLTLGSGAAAMVLGRSDLAPQGHQYRGHVTLAATEFNHLCRGHEDRMTTDTHGLLQAGIQLALRTLEKAKKELGWFIDQIDEFVVHQVSRAHTEKLAAALGLDLDKILPLYPEFGNVGPAAVPIALCKAVEQGRVKTGDRVALMGIGSGLNCTMAEMIW